jgi:hypothetical protein
MHRRLRGLFGCRAAVHFEMKFHKGSVASVESSQFVHTFHVRTSQHRQPDALPFFIRQFTIKELFKRIDRDFKSVPKHVTGDREGKCRVGADPTGQSGYTESRQNSEVDGNVREVVCTVRGYCRRTCFANHPCLKDHQASSGEQAGQDDRKPKIELRNLFGIG